VGFQNVCAEKVRQTNGQIAGEDLKRPTNQGNEISFILAYFLFFSSPLPAQSCGTRPTNKELRQGVELKVFVRGVKAFSPFPSRLA